MTSEIALPRKPERHPILGGPIRYEGGAGKLDGSFVITVARYAKHKYIIATTGHGGYKSRACRLASALTRGKWTRRCKGYVASAAQAEKFYSLYMAGWDACVMTYALEPPRTSE